MRMLERRSRAAHLGILLGLMGVGLFANVEPVEAQGSPPIIRSFSVWAETRPDFAEPHLYLSTQIDDPDGEVPATIQSVVVTDPNGGTLDLTSGFRYPNLGFRGEYFLDAGSPVNGTYTIAVTDAQGNTVHGSDNLAVAAPLLPPSVVSPGNEEITPTTTPAIRWDPVERAASTRVSVRNADAFNTFGDALYTSPPLAGNAAELSLPAGVLTPGRRYVLEIQAYDAPGGLPAANSRALVRRPFSVAGPTVGVGLNQGAFATGQTARLSVSLRNGGAPVTVDMQIWAGIPGGAILELGNVADVEIASTAPDVSTVMSDVITHTFDGLEPAGSYAVGVRLLEKATGATIAQSIGSFTFAP